LTLSAGTESVTLDLAESCAEIGLPKKPPAICRIDAGKGCDSPLAHPRQQDAAVRDRENTPWRAPDAKVMIWA